MPNRNDAGFTLVEMLIALVITGIMAAGVISLLMGQNRFYGSTDDVVYAEQNLRATSDLLGSELRGMFVRSSASSDLVTAQDDQLTFRLDTHRGVVCHVDGDDVYAFLFSEPAAPNVDGGAARGYAFREAYSSSAWTYDESWDPRGSLDRSTGQNTTITETCETNGGPADDAANYDQFVLFRNWGGASVPDDGSILRLFGRVTYSFGSSGFGSGTAVFRNGQELAAPFESDAAFSYVMDGGGVQSSVSSGSIGDVERIRISATAVGEGANRYDVTRDLEFDIPLKN